MKEIILVNCAHLQRAAATYALIKITNVKPLLIPVSRITEVRSLGENIPKDFIDEELKKQVKKISLDDELGGSLITYLSESGIARYETVLETPEAIYKQIYSE